MGRNILRNIVIVSLQAIFIRFRLVKLIEICFSVVLNVKETENIRDIFKLNGILYYVENSDMFWIKQKTYIKNNVGS